MGKVVNRYSALIALIFQRKYSPGANRVPFYRAELEDAAVELHIELPKNLGDIVYSFKYRTSLPSSIMKTAPDGLEWVIKNIGRGKYCFEQVKFARIIPDPMMTSIKIPDSTPSIVARYAVSDEQALLTKLRYNRLLDVFTGVTCYSLQNHLRTTVPGVGQIETDEIYVGIDMFGRQFVFPLQAKGGNDEIGIVQIEQDIQLCKYRYPELICRPIAAQFLDFNKIAIFEFTVDEGQIRKNIEKHYSLVPASEISSDDIMKYNSFYMLP